MSELTVLQDIRDELRAMHRTMRAEIAIAQEAMARCEAMGNTVAQEFGLCWDEGGWMLRPDGRVLKGSRGEMSASLQKLRADGFTDPYEVRALPAE